MSLYPLALTFTLLVFWTMLGGSLLAALEPGMPARRSLFLAPVTGVAATILPVFWLSLAGLPVSRFAWPLMAALCCVILGCWVWRRPSWSRKDLAFVLPVVAALILIGFPSLRFGFDWMANANDDWANYNLSAIRFINDGFYQQPSLEAMKAGRDYPGFLWFLVVAGDGRPGADLLLAFTSVLTGKNPFFIFMPLILAFHGVFCFAATGLAMSSIRNRKVLLAAMVLMAIAPLSLYAVHQQLIAQVIGLAFMCGIAALTCVPLHELQSKGRLALASIVAAAYWIMYPETVPFFVLAFLVFHALHIRDRAWGWSASWTVIVISILASALVGPYALSFFFYLMSQLQGSAAQGVYDGISIFPYFLVPSGLTVLFGFTTLGQMVDEPFSSLSIASSVAILVAMIFGIYLGLLRRSVLAAFMVVVVAVAAWLLIRHNDFGVFKIAMFAQAFIWFVAVLMIVRLRSRIAMMVYLSLLAVLVFTDVRYTTASLTDRLGGGNPLAGASSDRLLTRLLVDRTDESCGVNIDTSIPPLIKILGARSGCAQSFIARPALFTGTLASVEAKSDANPLHRPLKITEFTKRASVVLHAEKIRLPFNYPPLDDRPAEVILPSVTYAKTISDSADDSIWIDRRTGAPSTNHLAFLNSSLGSHYYLPDFGKPTIFASEHDYFFPEGTASAVGRYLLFRVDSPSESMRLVLDMTTSVLGDGAAVLPPATVIGDRAVPIGLSGHGAARVVSPPFSPLIVDGVAYVLLDMGADAKVLNVPRRGLMKLYGTNVSLDYRQMVGFARQIRVLDAGAELPEPPRKLEKFPRDLGIKSLQYSGIYEDGWLGDHGFVELSADKPGKAVIRGLFAQGVGFDKVDLTLSIAGGRSVVKHLTPGSFEVELPVEAGRRRISFDFSDIGRLARPDNRPVVALLSSIAIEEGDARESTGQTPSSLPEDLASVLTSEGLFQDGWLAPKGFISVRSQAGGTLLLSGLVPGQIGLDQQRVTISSGSGDDTTRSLEPGAFTIEIPVKPGESKLSFGFSDSAKLPNGDGRTVGALLKSVKMRPAAQ